MEEQLIDTSLAVEVCGHHDFAHHPAVTRASERLPLVCYPEIEESMNQLMVATPPYLQSFAAYKRHMQAAAHSLYPDGNVTDWEAVKALVPEGIRTTADRAGDLYDQRLDEMDTQLNVLVCAAVLEALTLAGVHDRPQAVGIARAVLYGGDAVPVELQGLTDRPATNVCPHCGSPTDADALRCGICRRYLA